MDTMTFPAKILKPLRITIPEAVGEALELKSSDLVEVTIKKIKSASKSTKQRRSLKAPAVAAYGNEDLIKANESLAGPLPSDLNE